MLRVLQPGRHLRSLAFQQEDDVEQSVVWRGSEHDRQSGPGHLEIEDLEQQEIARELLAIHAEFEPLSLSVFDELLQFLPTRIDAQRPGRPGPTMRNSFGDRSEPDSLEKSTLAPWPLGKTDVEAARSSRAQARYQLFHSVARAVPGGDTPIIWLVTDQRPSCDALG